MVGRQFQQAVAVLGMACAPALSVKVGEVYSAYGFPFIGNPKPLVAGIADTDISEHFVHLFLDPVGQYVALIFHLVGVLQRLARIIVLFILVNNYFVVSLFLCTFAL